MIVSVASGKGGTGKTTVAVNLALLLSEDGTTRVQFIDSDVEEPNAHIFLKPKIEECESIYIPVPTIDADKCTYCGRCAEVCAYNAIAVLKDKTLVFAQLCHGCGGCALLCPEGAIREENREIGLLKRGKAESIEYVSGTLNIGEAMATPLIKAIKGKRAPASVTLVDVPPGTACPVIEAVKGSDFVILVTEPTRFGLHDLLLAVSVVKQLRIPHGVVINQAGIGDAGVKEYCEREGIPVLGEIPYDRRIAVLYSQGIPMIADGTTYRPIFQRIWESVASIQKESERT
ncbi:(4Fe-4S)-binding protein [candidate division TA06 bacterium DG_26]|uniref:(4Fe-4S)-binding protein n=1 Tax=candidate division TA06 bacterium DG_26 TaxID=1703771 RepID=A0A0S7WMC0_UNCT6|nr:MAG: (4Fe-4S)-binding protein [candidate division TA06 bacterium DG_26]